MPMSNFHDVIDAGIQAIYEHDYEPQSSFLEIVCKDIRSMDLDVILQASGFYVPNNDYMKARFGPIITDSSFDCYNLSDECRWVNNVVFPIYNLNSRIVGLAGFNALRYVQAKENKDKTLNYYSYSNKSVFDKGKYLFCVDGTYRKALQEGYLIITDGLFDALSLSNEGYLAAALLGSTVTEEILVQLRFIKKIILAVDNDTAGNKLAEKLSRYLDNLFVIKQRYTKDVDDILKTGYKEKYLSRLDSLINANTIARSMVVF